MHTNLPEDRQINVPERHTYERAGKTDKRTHQKDIHIPTNVPERTYRKDKTYKVYKRTGKTYLHTNVPERHTYERSGKTYIRTYREDINTNVPESRHTNKGFKKDITKTLLSAVS